ncbi:lytic polysaccharide monooxygenase auxiliary activity family 9 protein [Nocardiopsis sp. NPDC049922]|uniref:lytic polysaccharide monooxygenase auxiliary activity family 9 protein n=1 Tax=Nocardiopsis sp. NPDC049922 TaxID=3155157 RepID=UPI00340FABA3
MKIRGRLRSITAVAAATAMAFTLMPAGVASAHGYVSSPPSRQAQCAARVVECGGIKWEPQSVEGPKGLYSCSGGNARFAELDDDDYGWDVTPVSSTLTFTWTFTAAHATTDWVYYVDGQEVARFGYGGHRPPWTVAHTVDLTAYSGQHKILAVWNIADTANAFYSCMDVNIGAAA